MLLSDEAINATSEDLLDRSDFAKSTAKALLNLTSNDTYTIGLFGKWGSGKTSLLNMILQEIKMLEDTEETANRTIIVHFDPWNFSSTDELLTQFFVRLISEFNSTSDQKLQSIASALEKYSFAFEFAKIIPGFGEVMQSAAKQGIKLFRRSVAHGINEKDISKQKENVINLLKGQSNRLLIVIDDIDRLSNDQIRYVFQLITCVAKFPKTTYLLAFDKDIVVKALEDIQHGDGEEYLEKIIQVPIQLPVLKAGKLRSVLFHRLDEVIAENQNVQFNSEYWQEQFLVCIDPFIRTLRDVNRLCNSIRFKLQAISEEVDFTDLTAITAIELNYPLIFNWIVSNKDILTGEYSNRMLGSYNWKEAEWNRITKDQWKELLMKGAEYNVIFEDSFQNVVASICHLFPAIGDKIGKFSLRGKPYNDQQLRKGNHIGHRDKFDRYFQLSLGDNSISHSDIVNVLNILSQDELISFFNEKDMSGNVYELMEDISAHVRELPLDRLIILINALFLVSASFDRTPHGFLSLSSSRYAEDLLLDLLGHLPMGRSFQLLQEIIPTLDNNSIDTLANIINVEELAYGRLAANGQKRDFNIVITEEELNELEQLFVERTKAILSNTSLFLFSDYRMTLYLLECFDNAFITDYLNNSFRQSINVIRFLENIVTQWNGSGVLYEISDSRRKYLSDGQIIKAIEECKDDGSLFSLPEKLQLLGAACWLYLDNKVDAENRVTKKAAVQLLNTWRTHVQQP